MADLWVRVNQIGDVHERILEAGASDLPDFYRAHGNDEAHMFTATNDSLAAHPLENSDEGCVRTDPRDLYHETDHRRPQPHLDSLLSLSNWCLNDAEPVLRRPFTVFQSSQATSLICGLTVSLLLAALPRLAHGAITPDLVASLVSGPAPLAVHFDASGTVVDDSTVNTFGDLGYKFNFGDPASGTWVHSNKSKNEQIGGPISAHIYETPGTYTAQLDVYSPAGEKAQKSVMITVLSADNVYAGSATVCLVMDPAKATLCPTGATVRTSPTSWGAFASDTRYMLAAGDDFTPLGAASINCENCRISKVGDGENPKLSKITYSPKPSYPPRKNFTVSQVQVQSVDVAFGENILIWRSKIIAAAGSLTNPTIMAGTTADYYYKNPGSLDPNKLIRPRKIVIAENQVDGSDAAVNGMFLVATQISVMGNEVRRPKEHDIRVPFTDRSFIAHNLLVNGANKTKHNIKLHGNGFDALTDEYYFSAKSPATNGVIISSNVIGENQGDVNNWQIAVAPQSDLYSEGLKNVVVEDNRFVFNSSAPGAQRQIVMTGKYLYERGNAFTSRGDRVSVGTDAQGNLVPLDWKGPYFSQPRSVSDWIPSALSNNPPAPINLRVE